MEDPLYSKPALVDPDQAARVESLIGDLCDHRQDITAALNKGDFAELQALARKYRASGERCGFPELAAAAAELERASQGGKAEEAVRTAAANFLAIVERLRPGLPVGA